MIGALWSALGAGRDDPKTVMESVVGEERRVRVDGTTVDLQVHGCTVRERAVVRVRISDPERPDVETYATDLRYVYTTLHEQSLRERTDPLVADWRAEDDAGGAARLALVVTTPSVDAVRTAVDRLERTVEALHAPFHRRVRECYRENRAAYERGDFCTFDLGFGVDESILPPGFSRHDAAAYAGDYFEWRQRKGRRRDRSPGRSRRPPADARRRVPA